MIQKIASDFKSMESAKGEKTWSPFQILMTRFSSWANFSKGANNFYSQRFLWFPFGNQTLNSSIWAADCSITSHTFLLHSLYE